MENIADTIITMVADHLRGTVDDLADVVPAARLDELGADSLDRVELAMAIESEFHIEIMDSTSDGWLTLQDMIDTVKKLLPA